MNKIRGAQLIIVAGIVFLIFNLSELDVNNLGLSKGPILGIVSNVLLIAAMFISIKEMKKNNNR